MSKLDANQINLAKLLKEDGVKVSEIARQLGCSYWEACCAVDDTYKARAMLSARDRRAEQDAATPYEETYREAIARACDEHLADLRRAYAQFPILVSSERPRAVRISTPTNSYVGSPALACARF